MPERSLETFDFKMPNPRTILILIVLLILFIVSWGSFRLLRKLPFCLLFLFVYLLFPALVLILLAFVSHCVLPFPVFPHLLAARVPLRRQFCLCVLSLSWRPTTIMLLQQFIDIWVPGNVNWQFILKKTSPNGIMQYEIQINIIIPNI